MTNVKLRKPYDNDIPPLFSLHVHVMQVFELSNISKMSSNAFPNARKHVKPRGRRPSGLKVLELLEIE